MLIYIAVTIALLQIYLPDGASGDFTVTLVVFSGRPDPEWTILPTDPSYKKIVAQLQKAKTAKLTYQPEDMPARLGYKGFLVQDTMKKEWDLIVGSNTVPLQQLLLKTMPKGTIPKATLKSVSEEIKKGKVSAELQVTKRFAPDYKPGSWNGNRRRLLNNNCYNYANDRATNTFAQPGRAFALAQGQIANRNQYNLMLNRAAVRDAAVNDGLQVVDVPQAPQGPFVQNRMPRVPKGQRHLVALVVDPGTDYHWYRLDSDGKWSHKPGQTRVIKYDNVAKDITDPRNANMGDYQFVCFMSTDSHGNAVDII